MRDIEDVFRLWDSTTAMAIAINAKPDTVRKWRKFRRIPQDSWPSVITAAAALGHALTADILLALNTPMKQRGRPAHEAQRTEAYESVGER